MILVTGDVVLDHNIYEGKRLNPTDPPGLGSYYVPMPGGAMVTYCLLQALDPGEIRFGLEETIPAALQAWPEQFHTRALWHAVANGPKPEDGQHWALERNLGYGEPGNLRYPAQLAPDLDAMPSILVIDDGGLGFRDSKDCWPSCLSQDQRPAELQWIILKMSRPLAKGDLWSQLVRDSWRERLIVIVSADQLRNEGLRVAGGLSWETSVNDIIAELESNHSLRGLTSCRHLIVTMRGDAALWLDQPAGSTSATCQLIFDRKLCEGEWEEKNREWNAYGFFSTVTTSVAWSISELLKSIPEAKKKEADDATGKYKAPRPDQLDFTMALAAGLSATRFLRQYGHGPAEKAPAFPFVEAANHLTSETAQYLKRPKFPYASAEVRCEGETCRIDAGKGAVASWTILGKVSPWHASKMKPTYGPARRVALLGPDKLPGVPCATFGKLQTLDRREIDSLRSLRQLMLMYRNGGARQQPLCLAVFGAPGSGKSFGLKQIAAGVFGDKVPILEFNLSQFDGPMDLIGAFHQVRDQVLSGPTPVVFWDEFDSNKLDWLQYFLAPMQDGAFQERQSTHFVGKSVFVFAGGTSFTFEQFRKPEDPKEFKLKKGTDFISRLAGYLDIAGPNPRENKLESSFDSEFPVRRAMVIRIALNLGDRHLEIERGLLTALLAVSRYKNGARSLDRLVTYIRDRGGIPLRRAYLPPDDILALHVEDAAEFHRLTRKYADFYSQAEPIARKIHEDYVEGLSREDRLLRPNAKPWDELAPDIKDSNLAAALRIPEILELAGQALEEGVDPAQDVSVIPADQFEPMAEAEHGGWEEQKRIDGWTWSPNRLDNVLRHDLLVPYDKLTEKIKEYDRNTIRKYPAYARDAGFKIVPKREGVSA